MRRFNDPDSGDKKLHLLDAMWWAVLPDHSTSCSLCSTKNMQQITCSHYCRFQKKLGVSGFSGYPKLFQLALQLAYLAGESTVIEYLDQCPGQFPAAPCGAGVQNLHAAYLLIVGLMRVAEHGKLCARLLRGIDK